MVGELLDLFIPTDEDGKGDGLISPTILSGSSITTYMRCPKQWEYAYVLRLKRPPSIKQGLGIAAHEAVAFNMEQKTLTYADLPDEEVGQKFLDTWDLLSIEIEDITEEARISEKTGKVLKSRKETKADARRSGAQAVMLYQEEAASKIQPVWVERQIQFKLNEEIDYSGIFDLGDDRNRVRDQKFVSKRPSDGGSYIVPMIGYALGYRQLTDSIEAEVVLDYIVRTAEPYYLPLASGGPITPEAINQFAKIVTDVHDGISRGYFPPTGLVSFACSWCGYADICPAYRAANGGRNV